MFATLLLAGAFAWLCIALAVGWLAFRESRRRRVQAVVTLFLLWLPFWDVIPGLMLYHKAIREVGGVRIYRTVEAEGYLDLSVVNCGSCWAALKASRYRYMEIAVSVFDPLPRASMVPVPGFYELRLIKEGSKECDAFESLSNVDAIRSTYGLGDSCVTATRRDSPISAYEYETSHGWEILWKWPLIRPVENIWQTIRDRSTGEVLAESRSIRFVSWLGTLIYVPRWQYIRTDSRGQTVFELTDIVKPI